MEQQFKILLIDSNKQSHDIFSFALNELHSKYCCRFATNDIEAINALRLSTPDYIFIDINSVQVDVKYLFKQFRKYYKNVKPSIVIYSERFDTMPCKRALRLGIHQTIKKSNEIFALITQMRKLFAL